MKKVICLLFVMFVSTLANAVAWNKNEIYCKNGYIYTMSDFIQFEDTQPWIGLIGAESVATKIPASPSTTYDCAYNDKIDDAVVGGVDGLVSSNKIYQLKSLSASTFAAFKCFCKLNANLLNNCRTHIADYSDTYWAGFIKQQNENKPLRAGCRNGEAKIYVDGIGHEVYGF